MWLKACPSFWFQVPGDLQVLNLLRCPRAHLAVGMQLRFAPARNASGRSCSRPGLQWTSPANVTADADTLNDACADVPTVIPQHSSEHRTADLFAADFAGRH